MSPTKTFKAKLRRATSAANGEAKWAFVILPKHVSDILPRRGRTTVDVRIRGIDFQATLEPDGQRSHWLKIDNDICATAAVSIGEEVSIKIAPVEREPEPEVPSDLMSALAANPVAFSTWHATTTLARLDWIHWITSAKLAKTRDQRIINAIDMLASGKKRVCCFVQCSQGGGLNTDWQSHGMAIGSAPKCPSEVRSSHRVNRSLVLRITYLPNDRGPAFLPAPFKNFRKYLGQGSLERRIAPSLKGP